MPRSRSPWHRCCTFLKNEPFFRPGRGPRTGHERSRNMAVSTQTTALIATFADRKRAERFLEELRRAGFQNDEIGMVSPDAVAPDGEGTHVEEGAAAGALTGGVLGAFAGALASGLIPGIGPVIAAGLPAGVVRGRAAGAATGGLLGALIGLGVPEEEARRHEQAVQQGRTLVLVQSKARNGEALAILRQLDHER